MKKYRIIAILWLLVASQAQAQFHNLGGAVRITSGSAIKALDGVINTDGGTLTVDGTLTTPADLSNGSGATLQGDGQYHIGGDWTNSATFNAGASTVSFEGDQNSTVASGGGAFNTVHLNKTAANLLLADDMDVTSTLDFQATENYVVLGDFNLQTGDILDYEASRHVRTTGAGFLQRSVGAAPVVFPIGNTDYNPATLANAGTADVYGVRVADAVLGGGSTGSPLTVDAVSRSWFVEEGAPGGSDLSLTLQWKGSDEQASFDRTNAYVSHFVAGSWDMQPTAAAAGADPYTLSRAGVTALSPFAVFDGDFTPVIDITGRIRWCQDSITGVKDVNVALSGDDTDADLTPLDGTYALTASNGSNFTITPAKNINKLNGVTVADATAIQQHVASLVIITDPYKLVAADVNKSNSISTLDASIIKQALLGNPAALAQFKTSWRFVPVSYNLQAPPWGFPETIGLTSVSGSVPGQDFYGIKTGDVVSEFANPASLQARPPLVLRAQDEELQTGQAITTTVRTDGFDDLAAWQFALQFDPKQLALRGVKPLSGLPLSAADFGTSGLAEGELRSVWSQAEGVALDAAAQVFELQFEVKQGGGRLSDALWLDPVGGEAGELPGLAFNSGRQASAVALRFDQASGVGDPAAAEDWQLLQNQPNPFTDETTIGFVLPAGGCQAQLRLYDAAGKLLWTADKAYPGGYSAERVQLAGITAAGVLYYELTTPFGVRTRRMVRVWQ